MVGKTRLSGKLELAFLILMLVGIVIFVQKSNQSQPNETLNDNKCNFENYIFGQTIEQSDPCLIAAFNATMLIPPPSVSEQLENRKQLNNRKEIPTNIAKFKWVEKLLIETQSADTKSVGFYIECGANDGEYISPTIRLEKTYNWMGLLIEANPIPFQSLLKKKRNAWTVNAALCTTTHPQPLVLFTYPNTSDTGVSGLKEEKMYGQSKAVTVPCIPLYTILAALDINIVDYFSLDVEGAELEILKTVPFDKIKFKIMTVEYWHIPGGDKPLRNFLEANGYKFIKNLKDRKTKDSLFVHESLYELARSVKI